LSAQIALELEALGDRIRRMRGIGRNGDMDPFFVDRSQAAHDARSLAEWLRTGRRPADYVPAAERGAIAEGRARYSNGRGSGVR
jgi:hypothetical protein